jgi:hypothetical protein
MATGDSLLNERPSDCPIAPGDQVELDRLPGIEFEVKAVLCRIGEEYSPRYLLELANPDLGTVFAWHEDRDEVLYRLTPEPR